MKLENHLKQHQIEYYYSEKFKKDILEVGKLIEDFCKENGFELEFPADTIYKKSGFVFKGFNTNYFFELTTTEENLTGYKCSIFDKDRNKYLFHITFYRIKDILKVLKLYKEI